MQDENQTPAKPSIKINLTVIVVFLLLIIPIIYLMVSKKDTTTTADVSQQNITAPATPAVVSKIDPRAEKYFIAGYEAYQEGDFNLCIELNKKAIALQPDYVRAYNNLCSAYNSLKMWDKGIEACNKAIEIDPNFQLAKNNLNWAITSKAEKKESK
jgi:tetratricopeptide (TPR) repeat protein